MYNYDGLTKKLVEKRTTKTALVKELGISSRTIAKINRNEKISINVLKKIAVYLNCSVDELYRKSFDNPILEILTEEKNNKISGGLYHELQIRMTYNSNHIEGSKLTEEQTRYIFETQTLIDIKDGLPVDDIIETINHFRAIDYVIDCAEEELNEEIIKKLHYILKQGTSESRLSWFMVGDYKIRPNVVGGIETAKPKDVSNNIKELLKEYNSKKIKTINDIIAFHHDFECIHPFQDGNGRVGRLIALKECLKFNIVPFIIEDNKKVFYYRGLSKWNEEKGYLIDTCLDGQDTFKKLLDMFDIKY